MVELYLRKSWSLQSQIRSSTHHSFLFCLVDKMMQWSHNMASTPSHWVYLNQRNHFEWQWWASQSTWPSTYYPNMFIKNAASWTVKLYQAVAMSLGYIECKMRRFTPLIFEHPVARIADRPAPSIWSFMGNLWFLMCRCGWTPLQRPALCTQWSMILIWRSRIPATILFIPTPVMTLSLSTTWRSFMVTTPSLPPISFQCCRVGEI